MRFDPSAAIGVPAHVTVLWPFVPPRTLTRSSRDAVGRLFAMFEPFDFELSATARFPEGVLYLVPQPAAPFSAMIEAVWQRFPEHPPYGAAFDTIIPHLTVADCSASDLCDDAEANLRAAEAAVAPGLPIRGRVEEIWLMTLAERWTLAERFRLGGAST
jgi:hypothetical protein